MALSCSTENKSLVLIKEKPMQCYMYPAPIAQYEDVIASPQLFMDILGKFHAAMGTKFKIPIVAGVDLDLHRLFMEVTSRGGIQKVLEEKKWREVTNCFSFPPSATNASFILRKYYMSLVHHFEQVYYLRAKTWTPVPTDTWQSTNALTSTAGSNIPVLPSPEIQETSLKRQRTVTNEDALTKGSLDSSIGLPVTGVLDGKFESGYLCTVIIGGEQLQGVLYQTVHTPLYEKPKHEGQVTTDATNGLTVVRSRRRRRKKSEMRKRDPAHPKPNRSGYNFFFAEQHAILKSRHTGKDRGVSKMVGDEWNKLTESEKAVYQEMAVKDKERYKSEMEIYREGIKRGQVLTTSIPIQQQYYMVNPNVENNCGNLNKIIENEPNSEYYDDDNNSSSNSSFEGDVEETTGNVSNFEMRDGNVDMECKKPLKFEDDEADVSGQQKLMPVQANETLFFENELTLIQENLLKQDEKSPDIYDENKTKTTDNQEQGLEVFDENRPFFTNEERDLENSR